MFKVHEEFAEHEKLDSLMDDPELWCRVVAVWLAAGCDSRKRLTDGRVPRARLRRITPLGDGALAIADKLVELKLWELEGSVYVFHDWADVQDTKAEVKDQRAEWKLKKRASRAKRLLGRAAVPAVSTQVSPGDTLKDSLKDSIREFARESRAVSTGASRTLKNGTGTEEEEGSDLQTRGEESSEIEHAPVRGDSPAAGAEYRAVNEMRRYPGLVNLASHDFQSWREDYAFIGSQPEAQRRVAFATLAASAWAAKHWHACTPRHVRKHWQAYASGNEPGYQPSANDNGRPQMGMSEVGRPEDFEENPTL